MDGISTNGHADEVDVIDLLDEYMTAKENGRQIDIRSLEQRAGTQAAALRRHIEVAERVADLSRLIAVEPEGVSEVHTFGRFQTTEVLGTGGYSKVYLAEDPNLGRQIALKVLPLSYGSDDTTLAEARSIASLDHPSVVKVYEVGEFEERGGMAYIAMERINGPDLRSVMRKLLALDEATRTGDGVTGGLDLIVAKSLRSTAARCRLVARIARALAYCHSEGIVHRDLKPENVLVQDGLNPTLVDFGMAREESADLANATQGLRGTPAYFAPEQVDQGTGGASVASDQFSLGVLLYELLTLAHPFRTSTLNGTMSAISASAPTPIRKRNPSIPLDVELICSRAMSREPSQRYVSTKALAEDLEAFLEHRAVSVRPPSVARQLALGAVRHRKSIGVALAACTLLVGLLVVAWVATFLRDRRSLAEFVQFRSRAVEQLSTPAEFDSHFNGLLARRADAEAVDDSVLGRALGADLGAQLDHLWEVGIRTLEVAAAPPKREIRPSANLARFGAYFQQWRALFGVVSYRAPDDIAHGFSISGGLVKLPVDGRLVLFHAVKNLAIPVCMEIEDWSKPLEPGRYRYTRGAGEMSVETEFFVHADDPPWTPTLLPLSDQVASGLTRVAAGEAPSIAPLSYESIKLYTRLATGYIIPPATRVRYGPFRIAREAVTWAEFRAAFSPEELVSLRQRLRTPDVGDDDFDQPAVVPSVYAREYAARMGARLPSAMELFAAARQPEFQLGDGLRSEWTSECFSLNLGLAFYLRYSTGGVAEPTGHFTDLGRMQEESNASGIGFRLARSLSD